MKEKGILICLTGIDGSGKTTLSKGLLDVLNKDNDVPNFNYVYGRLEPKISKIFMVFGGFIFLRNKNISKNYADYSETKKVAMESHSFLTNIYQKVIILDYTVQIFFKITLPLILRRNIICDRYIYDTVITDFSVDMNISEKKSIKLLNDLLKFFPKPKLIFLVDISEEIAFKRKNDIPDIEYLKERRQLYINVGKELGMIIINGSESIDELKNKSYLIIKSGFNNKLEV